MPLDKRAAARVQTRSGVLPNVPRSTIVPARQVQVVARRSAAAFPPVVHTVPSSRPVLPVRLRYVVLLIAAGLSIRSLGFRALAYWQLHEAAAQLGNYAACMVGPTGPKLLREQPTDFWKLVRRRIVAAASDSRPFAPCLPALRAFAGDARRPAHEARASEFVEHAPLRRVAKPRFQVSDLTIGAERLVALQAEAWPFAPSSMDELVRPERRATVAPHPVDPPRPVRGRGLPPSELGYSALRITGSSHALVTGQGANVAAYRSDDGGVSWAAAKVDDPAVEAWSGFCASDGAASRFRLRHTGDQLRVDSWQGGEIVTSFPLVSADGRLTSFACDSRAAVAAVREPAEDRPMFRVCPHGGACKNLPVPPLLRTALNERASLSIARIEGATVIATGLSGVVRVISSRDDGETWTPPVVAYDGGERTEGDPTPTHLLALGQKLALFAGAEGGSAYPVLFSADLGASWQER